MARKIASLILKSVVVVFAVVGVIISVVENYRHLLFFTIQSNIWICIACLVGLVLMLTKAQVKSWMYSLKLIFTVSITLTGVVYCTMLAPTLGAYAYTFSNTVLHMVVPVAAIADFFVFDNAVQYRKWECVMATIPPFYYLAFAGVGYALNWNFVYGLNYPYFFLNWGSPAGAFGFSNESPYLGVIYYVLILLVFVIGVGALYVGLSNLIHRKQLQNQNIEIA